MSGGSYDYLYTWPDRHGSLPLGHLREMAARAEALAPGSPGTIAMRELVVTAEALEAQWIALRGVMHDIEWADSGDYDDAQAEEALRTWNTGDTP